MQARVSFVVPCFNYGRFVGQAIESLLGQTFGPLELIVIDDASTDDTGQVLAPYDDHPKVQVIRHARNLGHICSLNEGLARAQGQFVGVMDADDLCLHPDAVARQVALFDAHPEVGLVYSAFRLVDGSGRPFRDRQPWPDDYVRDGLEEFTHLVNGNYIPHSGPLMRSSCHAELGPYDPELPHAGDWDRWLRLTTRHDTAYLAEPLYGYRVHDTNMSHATVSPRRANGEHLLVLQKAYQALPPTAPDTVRRSKAMAMRRALLTTAWGDRSLGRTRRSWAGLLDAVRRSPALAANPEFHGHLARLALLTVLGHQRYVQLTAWQHRTRESVSAHA